MRATWNVASGVDNAEDGANTVDSVDDKEREEGSSVRIGRESDERNCGEPGKQGDQGAGERGSTAEIWVFVVVRTILWGVVLGP